MPDHFQPVGFVTFSSRVAAEAAKQDLQVRVTSLSTLPTHLYKITNLCHVVLNYSFIIRFKWCSFFNDLDLDSYYKLPFL